MTQIEEELIWIQTEYTKKMSAIKIFYFRGRKADS